MDSQHVVEEGVEGTGGFALLVRALDATAAIFILAVDDKVRPMAMAAGESVTRSLEEAVEPFFVLFVHGHTVRKEKN